MKSLSEYIQEARAAKKAIGHFNVANLEGFWAVVNAAKELNVPVIIGVSEGERDFMGVQQIAALVQSIRATGQPVFLNADHTYSFERVQEAVDAGFDAVIFDGTELPFDENVAMTKKCVEYAKAKNPHILVEAEIGFIGKSSKILDAIPEGVRITEEFLTKPEEAKTFVEATGVDLLAPAVGNIHGMLKGGKDPALNVGRIAAVYDAVKIPLVLHGGSGGSEEDFVGAIENGCAIIHISTELRVAYRSGLVKALQDNPDEVAPYKYLKPARAAMQAVVAQKLKLFNRI
jgi:fructose-bisphosphate aldolase class II